MNLILVRRFRVPHKMFEQLTTNLSGHPTFLCERYSTCGSTVHELILRRGLTYVPMAFIAPTMVTCCPSNALPSAPTCLRPFVPSIFWHLFWTVVKPDIHIVYIVREKIELPHSIYAPNISWSLEIGFNINFMLGVVFGVVVNCGNLRQLCLFS